MANILIIEDNNDIHELLKDLFQAEHRVYSAYSGTEGLLVFAQQKIDLVLLDIMLPGKNGDQVLAEIRKSSQIPVVMLTALGEKSLVSQYLLNGANDYIVKPFNLDEVFARVTVQLRSHFSRDQIDEIQRVKNIRLLPDTFEVVKGDNRVRLGRKEYQILQTLLYHPKKIYTKEELFELVWEEPYLPGDNTLNTHLSNLRKKLAQLDPTEEYIETIWGLGVRIKED
ncbi:Transcriptional regulatory protein WalR [Streptococcus intermedius]|uniref:Transcriptional regulatory protein WalR n=1 Tax=Streptococcus intermedius TaxID=1338 RepID=A0AAE8G277_STRIT|nr:response regulator transcription factor [Streptococcus intermedius]RSJ23004.1 Transcriptional regulatory protein WalR [Streptococcus intermedius]